MSAFSRLRTWGEGRRLRSRAQTVHDPLVPLPEYLIQIFGPSPSSLADDDNSPGTEEVDDDVGEDQCGGERRSHFIEWGTKEEAKEQEEEETR